MYGDSLREEICQKSIIKSIKNENIFKEIFERFLAVGNPISTTKHCLEHPSIGFNFFVK